MISAIIFLLKAFHRYPRPENDPQKDKKWDWTAKCDGMPTIKIPQKALSCNQNVT